jgi:hypothetical protein
VRRVSLLAIFCILSAASIPVPCEEPVVSIGKQRAARSTIEWDVNDIDHPLLGPIKAAVQRGAVATAAQREKILSRVFVSCQKGDRKVAIELANAFESDLAGGLRPMEMPRLVCSSPGPAGNGSLVKSDIAAKWEIAPLGDSLARGLSPSGLRRCVSIDVLQSVALPPGSSETSQRIAFEITPYNRALDSVFAACGETTAFAPVEQKPSAGASWKPARTTTKGKTNVRAAASLDSPIVRKLDPGTRILVQETSAPWCKVKPRSGEGFHGYVRKDRLAFE